MRDVLGVLSPSLCKFHQFFAIQATECVVGGKFMDGISKRRVRYSVGRSVRKMGGKVMLVKLNDAAGVQV